MTDKEEVEPSEESAPIESSDASANPEFAGATAIGRVDDPVDPDPAEAEGIGDNDPKADELKVSSEDDANEVVDDDRFDEIVRDSGIGESDDNGSTDDDGSDKALEPAGVAAAAAGSTAVGTSKPGRQAKGVATQRRDQPVKPERTGPVKFVRESVGELRKVVYPTGQQLINYFVVVLVFVLFIIGYVSLLDLGLGALIFKIFS